MSEAEAIGWCIQAWRMALQFWKRDQAKIPLRLWRTLKFPDELVEVGLAEIIGEEVYVKGSEEHFSWLAARVSAGKAGGRKSGEVRRAKTLPVVIDNEDLAEANAKQTPSKTKPLTLTLSLKDNYPCQPDEETPLFRDQPPPADSLPPLAKIWNDAVKGSALPPVRAVTGNRKRSCEARWRENRNPGYWAGVIARVLKSDFLTGRVPGKTWLADFDWLVRPDTHVRVIEGKYDNRSSGPGGPNIKPLSAEDLKL